MRDAIIEKLNRHFTAPPKTEADVAYAFVQLRKLLERNNDKKKFPRLTFFCDWVVHGHLSGPEAKLVLIELDERLRFYKSSEPEGIDRDGHVLEILSHRLLQRELSSYLIASGVNDSWTSIPSSWYLLSKLYSEIVRDCPLKTSRHDHKFKYLANLAITECEPSPLIVATNPGGQHIGWKWTFTLSDGRSFEMTYTSSFGRGLPDIP